MKLLFVTRVLGTRGGNLVLAKIVQKMQEEGIDCHLTAFKPAGTEDFPGGSEYLFKPIKNLEIIEVEPSTHPDAMMNSFINASTAYIKANQGKYDKVILDSWYTAMAGVLAQVDQGKTYHLVQSDPYFEPENDDALWRSRALELVPYFPLKRIVVSKSIQKLFDDRYSQHFPAINLFIDDAYYDADFAVVDRDVTRFITSASDFNIPSKGLDFLLQSLQKLDDKNFSLTVLTGVPLKQKITGYDFPTVVASAQGPKQMINVLSKHDVYINTSTKETFCLALAEAIALGMPAIALDSIGNRDYSHGDNFVFVENKSDFVNRLDSIRNVSVRKLLHQAARPSMRHYKLDDTVKEFKQAIGL